MQVAVYFYTGEKNNVITIVNIDSTAHTIDIELPFSDKKSD